MINVGNKINNNNIKTAYTMELRICENGYNLKRSVYFKYKKNFP